HALGVGLGRVVAAADRGPRLLGLDELLQLVERDVEQIAQPLQLEQALDVVVVVDALRALAPLPAGEEADFLVVADRPRRRADALRDLADPDHAYATSRTCAGRSIDTPAPSSEMPASTHSARCMLAMNGSSWAVERPDVSPEKISNSTGLGTAAVTIASTKAIEITAPVFCSITRAPAAIPRRWVGTTPIIAAVFGLLNMPEPVPTSASQSALQT